MLKKYLQICDLLEQLGSPQTRLELIQEIIQKPDFKYQKESFPEILTDTLAQSAYWLDTELFDESYLYKKPDPSLFPMQNIHLKMLDIGVSLLDKGFPLKYNTEKYSSTGKANLAAYAKTFIEQCHKRRDFLHRKTTHKEKKILPPIQKTLA